MIFPGKRSGILIALLLIGLNPANAQSASADLKTDAAGTDAYIQQVQRLIAAHRSHLARLDAAVAATANGLISGGSYTVCCGENAWTFEAYGRAGGSMGLAINKGKKLSTKDVVWASYTLSSYPAAVKAVAALKPGPVVVWFGPLPPGGPPGPYFIDSMTGFSDKQKFSDDKQLSAAENFTLLANVISLWEATGELAAATARQNQTLVFWQSVWGMNAATRNGRYMDQLFHQSAFPKMARDIAPGVLSGQYLDYLAHMVDAIATSELPAILATGKQIAQRAALSGTTGGTTVLGVTTHVGRYVAARNPALQIADLTGPQPLSKWLKRDGYLVHLGYYGLDRDVWLTVRNTPGAHAAWIAAPEPHPPDFAVWGDTFISEHWDFGDGVVAVPGYDVPILPASGIAELFVYELLLMAAN